MVIKTLPNRAEPVRFLASRSFGWRFSGKFNPPLNVAERRSVSGRSPKVYFGLDRGIWIRDRDTFVVDMDTVAPVSLLSGARRRACFIDGSDPA
jgi:hypothetical protein